MRFWDSSALVPLLVEQPGCARVRRIPATERIVWWGARVEGTSAVMRLSRTGAFDRKEARRLLEHLGAILSGAAEVGPTEAVRSLAVRALAVHVLRGADALQLAAALVAADGRPSEVEFVSLDTQLRSAALAEGFQLAPEDGLAR